MCPTLTRPSTFCTTRPSSSTTIAGRSSTVEVLRELRRAVDVDRRAREDAVVLALLEHLVEERLDTPARDRISVNRSTAAWVPSSYRHAASSPVLRPPKTPSATTFTVSRRFGAVSCRAGGKAPPWPPAPSPTARWSSASASSTGASSRRAEAQSCATPPTRGCSATPIRSTTVTRRARDAGRAWSRRRASRRRTCAPARRPAVQHRAGGRRRVMSARAGT